MPASVTTIQGAVKTAITTAAAVNGTFALPLSVEVADSQAAPPQKPSDCMQVQIAYIGAAELARSSTRVLEQTLLGVNLSYRNPKGDQQRFGQCHQVAQKLRDLLVGFTTDGARVEQVFGAEPI